MRGGGNGAFVFGSNVAMREIEVLARDNALKQGALSSEFNGVPTHMRHFVQHAPSVLGRHASHRAGNHAQTNGQMRVSHNPIDTRASRAFHACLEQQVLT